MRCPLGCGDVSRSLERPPAVTRHPAWQLVDRQNWECHELDLAKKTRALIFDAHPAAWNRAWTRLGLTPKPATPRPRYRAPRRPSWDGHRGLELVRCLPTPSSLTRMRRIPRTRGRARKSWRHAWLPISIATGRQGRADSKCALKKIHRLLHAFFFTTPGKALASPLTSCNASSTNGQIQHHHVLGPLSDSMRTRQPSQTILGLLSRRGRYWQQRSRLHMVSQPLQSQWLAITPYLPVHSSEAVTAPAPGRSVHVIIMPSWSAHFPYGSQPICLTSEYLTQFAGLRLAYLSSKLWSHPLPAPTAGVGFSPSSPEMQLARRH